MHIIKKIKLFPLPTLFLGLFYFLLVVGGNAQTITQIEFQTGYKLNKNGNFAPRIAKQLETIDDTTFLLSFYAGDSSNNMVGQHISYCFNYKLQVVDSFINWKKDTSHVPYFFGAEQSIRSGISKDHVLQTPYRYFVNSLNDSTLEYQLYTLKNKAEKDSLVFSQQFVGRSAFYRPFIYNDKLVLISVGGPNYIDSNYIDSYSISTNQAIKTRSFTPSAVKNTFIDLKNFQNPLPFLDSDSLFYVVGAPELAEIVVFNHNSLELDRIGGLIDSLWGILVATHQINGFPGRAFFLDSSGVEIVGEMNVLRGPVTDDKQFGIIKVDWNDSIVSIKQYGDTLIDEAPFNAFQTDSSLYMVGNSPRPVSLLGNNKVLLYRLHSNGYDSLLLFGNKGYITEEVLVNQYGDVFLSSTYANPLNSDSSINIVVTKIPALLIGLAEQYSERNSIRIYPNPSRDYLYSEAFGKGDRYSIFAINGQRMQEGRLNESSKISIQSLKSGTYILQLQSKRGVSSVVFVKQ